MSTKKVTLFQKNFFFYCFYNIKKEKAEQNARDFSFYSALFGELFMNYIVLYSPAVFVCGEKKGDILA